MNNFNLRVKGVEFLAYLFERNCETACVKDD
jgi:hypothetical protein